MIPQLTRSNNTIKISLFRLGTESVILIVTAITGDLDLQKV
jgi:hypothetical protein